MAVTRKNTPIPTLQPRGVLVRKNGAIPLPKIEYKGGGAVVPVPVGDLGEL